MKSGSPTDKKTPAATLPPEPTIRVTVIKVRQPDGSLLFKAGRPEIVEQEVSVALFHRETGVSKRHVATLCEQGLIQHRRLTPKKDSKILIPRSEIDRFRNLTDDTWTPSGEFARTKAAGNGSDASHPGAANGGSQFNRPSHPQKSNLK